MAYKRILSSKIKIPENEHEDFPTVANGTLPFASALCEVIRNSRNIISSPPPVPSRTNRIETSIIRNQIPINTNPVMAKIQGNSIPGDKNSTFKRPFSNRYCNNQNLEKKFDSTSGEIFSDVSPRYSHTSKTNTRFFLGQNATDSKRQSSSRNSSTMAEMQCIIQTIRNTNKEIFEALNNTNRQVTETMKKINVDVENALVKIITHNAQKEKVKALTVKKTKDCSTETIPVDPKTLKAQNKKSTSKTNKSKTDTSSSKKIKIQKLIVNDNNFDPTSTKGNKITYEKENRNNTDIELKRSLSFPEVKNTNSLIYLEIEQKLKDKIKKEVKDALTGDIHNSKEPETKSKSNVMFFLPETENTKRNDEDRNRTEDSHIVERHTYHPTVYLEDSKRSEPLQEKGSKKKKQKDENQEEKDHSINIESKKSETRPSEKLKKKTKSSKNHMKVTQSIGTEVTFCTCDECLKKLNIRQSLAKRSMNSKQASSEMEKVVEDEECLSSQFLLAEQFHSSEVIQEHSRESKNMKYERFTPNSDSEKKKNTDTVMFYPVKVKTWFQNRRAKWRRCNSVSSNSSESAKGIYNEDSENELGEVDLSRSASPSKHSIQQTFN